MTAAAALAVLAVAGLLIAALVDDRRSTEVTERSVRLPLSPAQPGRSAPDRDAARRATELAEARRVQLGIAPPARFPPATPRRALAGFMEAWHERAFGRMATWSTASWNLAPQPDRRLRRGLGWRRLGGYVVLEAQEGPIVSRYEVLVAYSDLRPRVRREVLRLRALRQNRAGRLVERGGRWGIDPTSVEPVPPAGG